MSLAADHPGTVAVHIGFDEGLAHLIYAGSDALAVPRRFEPCGLSQMIAMRYGTLPVVRATGGLRDTVDHGRTGFVFEQATADAVAAAAAETLDAYGDQARWRPMMVEAMRQDTTNARQNALFVALFRSLHGS